jgi:ribosomal protein L40E
MDEGPRRGIPRAGKFHCPTCGMENKFDAVTCRGCKSKLDLGVRCTVCGARLDSSAKFCTSCGSPQRADSGPVVDPRLKPPMTLNGEDHPLAADDHDAATRFRSPDIPEEQPQPTAGRRPTMPGDAGDGSPG